MKKDELESICFIVPSLQKGGMERVISLLSNNICEYETTIYIVTLTSDVVEYEFDSRIKIIHLNKKLINRVTVLFDILKVLKRIKPKVVVGFSEVFNPLTILGAKTLGIPVFVSDRSNPLIKYSKRDAIFKKLTYPFANGIIAQTSLAKEKLQEKKLNANIVVIPNPVTIFKNRKFNFESKKIITVGRLIKSKNQIELIKIFQDINNPSWELLLVGDGNYRAEIEKYIEINELGHFVKLRGKKDDIEVELEKASIFAFTSISEGFPNVVLEALSFPLATIAYDCPAGVSDIIENGKNGHLVPLHNSDDFKEKLISLMSSEQERLKFMKNGILTRKKFSQTDISDRFYEFIKTI